MRPLSRLAVHRQGRQRAGHLCRSNADLREEEVGGRPLAGEDVPAPVQPVAAAPLRPDATSHPAAGLQEDDVPVPQPPSSRQPGEATADDDDVRHGHGDFPSAIMMRGSEPRVSGAQAMETTRPSMVMTPAMIMVLPMPRPARARGTR